MAGIAGGGVIDGALVVGVRALVTKVTGSGYYLVFDETYDKMIQKGVEWTNNMTYLKDADSLGSRFVLAPDFVVREGGTFWKEVWYLIENGIPWEMF